MKKSPLDRRRRKQRNHAGSPAAQSQGDNVFHYLPITDEIFHCGFYVTSAGHSTTAPGISYPPTHHPSLYHFAWQDGRVLPEFSLLLITEGKGTFESKATGSVSLQAGMMVLLLPGVWHRYRPVPEIGWTERWMHFNGEFAHLLLNKKVIAPERAIFTIDCWRDTETAMQVLLTSIQEMPSSNSLLISLQALGALSTVIGRIYFTGEPRISLKKEPKEDSLVADAVDYIWARSHHVLSVPDVARELGVTRRTLERHMLALRGHSVLAEIILCRFTRAERLLRETDLPIGTVVSLAGFGSSENMRQTCLAKTGRSPAGYRELFRRGSIHDKENTVER